MSNGGNALNQGMKTTKLADSWPHLLFLGLGVWWAWVWLLFSSTNVAGLFPTEIQSDIIWKMYLVSTTAIAICMVVYALAWKSLTKYIDRRGFIIAFGGLASTATLLLIACTYFKLPILFYCATACTGIGTSALCIKAGRIYGSVTLTESLSAGCLSLMLAAGLYFAGVSVPSELSLVLTCLLPLISSFMLALPTPEEFPSVIQGSAEALPFSAPERTIFRRVVIAVAVVAFTAGVGKGICSVGVDAGAFSDSGSIAVFAVAVIGVIVMMLVERARSAHGLRMVYTVLMAAGILEMLATCFGFNIFYLIVGKEVLWMVLGCFIAYLVFKFDLSALRSFGIAYAAYYAASLTGWLIGGELAPLYSTDITIRMAVGVVLACMVMFVLIFVLTEANIRQMVEWSCESPVSDSKNPGVVVSVNMAGEAGTTNISVDPNASIAEITTDDLERARDPKYGLSDRELEILEPFAQGRSAAWIAEKFVISKNTVRSHLRNIYTKLDVHTRQELLDFLAGE